mmetsp:Transcript_7601/g.13081  ORF Transcript_7601/g.13081 Transcript_7601/m.13081 type:complete len:235 (+) Transcript_7601:127-831(+)|eukprot:CAMPEP_0198225406 /NCGR_PEP_ID=MMETSP1445-20131203/101008_1 /TAXON_ID=36898 /ORGANISM="Pyramimonas sp., Strain CCMP2087" /LENGTH=234 /DNA_ID=CAMNT_0043904913 /DNA_START=125 /DNA_END=829 /DNA_ORIENTATION=-
MKFLEYTPLSRVAAFLQNVNLGDYVVQGEIQAYSCKLAGVDKKLSCSIDQEVVCSLATTPLELLSASPVGPLTDASSRKTLIYLILTLNHSYPDYDFSCLRAHHFRKEEDVRFAKENIDHLLLESAKLWDQGDICDQSERFSEVLWAAVDEVIGLVDCDVYQYNAIHEGDPFAESGHLWSFNYFFYNKKSKRVVYFSCRSKSKASIELTASSDSEYDDMEPYEEDPFMDGMELN